MQRLLDDQQFLLLYRVCDVHVYESKTEIMITLRPNVVNNIIQPFSLKIVTVVGSVTALGKGRPRPLACWTNMEML